MCVLFIFFSIIIAIVQNTTVTYCTLNQVTYGDASTSKHSFFGVQRNAKGGGGEWVSEVSFEWTWKAYTRSLQQNSGFMERVSLLRLLVDPRAHEDRFRSEHSITILILMHTWKS